MGAHAGGSPAIPGATANRPGKFLCELSPRIYGVHFEQGGGGRSLSRGGGEIESVFIASLAVPGNQCLPPKGQSAGGAALPQGNCTRRTERLRRSARYPEGLHQSWPDPCCFRKSNRRTAILRKGARHSARHHRREPGRKWH